MFIAALFVTAKSQKQLTLVNQSINTGIVWLVYSLIFTVYLFVYTWTTERSLIALQQSKINSEKIRSLSSKFIVFYVHYFCLIHI